jgi:hypothetical protein
VQGRVRIRFNDVGGAVQSINYGITQYDPYFVGDTGVGWYVRVQGGLSVFCYQGNADGDGKGCQARTSGIVDEDAWHELIISQNPSNNDFWLMMVSGGSLHTVAYVYGPANRSLIYASVGTEFNYPTMGTAPTDYPGGFSFRDPAYDNGSGPVTIWPGSSGSNVNYFDSYSAPCNSPYRGQIPYLGNYRYWYAGTGGGSGWDIRCYLSPQF